MTEKEIIDGCKRLACVVHTVAFAVNDKENRTAILKDLDCLLEAVKKLEDKK